jgi:hypothetical protein
MNKYADSVIVGRSECYYLLVFSALLGREKVGWMYVERERVSAGGI